MEMIKVVVKVKTEDGIEKWVHFCYVADWIKNKFEEKVNIQNHTTNYWVTKWAHEDFGDVSLDDIDDLNILKDFIRTSYMEKYPELDTGLDKTDIDRVGWIRVWYTKHMEAEISAIG